MRNSLPNWKGAIQTYA